MRDEDDGLVGAPAQADLLCPAVILAAGPRAAALRCATSPSTRRRLATCKYWVICRARLSVRRSSWRETKTPSGSVAGNRAQRLLYQWLMDVAPPAWDGVPFDLLELASLSSPFSEHGDDANDSDDDEDEH